MGPIRAGTKDDPWQLSTAPGSSRYSIHRDESVDPPILVCQVGSTTLTYRLRAIEDLHAWLSERATGCRSAQPMRRSRQSKAALRRGDGPPIIRSAAGTGYATGTGVGSGCTCRPCWNIWDWLS